MNKVTITIIVVCVAGLLGYASTFYLGKDNVVEEQCEQVIHYETGQDIDLSGPDAPEDQAPKV